MGVVGSPRAMPVAPRLWAKVEKTETCWLWNGALTRGGYGAISVEGEDRAVHRVAYELLVGPIPDGLQLDHLCRVRNCVRPEHLEPVTPRENTMRGETITATHASKTHCVRGHEFDEANTYRRSDGSRMCRACMAVRHARHRQAKRLELSA